MSIKIRMCIICKSRAHQSSLLRLQIVDDVLVLFQGKNRSFYICSTCLGNATKLDKYLSKKLKIKDINHSCKETIEDVRHN